MLSKDQEQEVAGNSVAIQAGRDVTIITHGLTLTEARDVALDVFKSNFYQLAGVAQEIAKTRAEEITEAFLSKLQTEHPAGLHKSHDPDFQYALFTVQKEYARNGDKDLGDLLVDLLVDRSKQDSRDILQIVLNESLNTAPKLTECQLAALAMIFGFKYTQNHAIINDTTLGEYFDVYASHFASLVVSNRACYQHLEFCGCGSAGLTQVELETIMGQTYQGLFLKGFIEKDATDRGINQGLDPAFFMQCINNSSRLQVRARSAEVLEKLFEQHNVINEDRVKIKELFELNKMSNQEIREKCISIRPYMARLFEVWSGSLMKNFTLTSVGIAIGHANIKRLNGEFADLSIWIN